MEQQLVVHGPLADLGPQPGDLVIPFIHRPALQGGLAAGQEVVAPSGEGGCGHAEFTRDQFEVLASEESEDGVGLAPGGEASAVVGGRCVGHGWDFWTRLNDVAARCPTEPRSGGIVRSDNSYDWLGNGVYYWEYAPIQAWRWAERKRKREAWDEDVAVVASMIRLGFCFDLLDPENVGELKFYYNNMYMKDCDALGQKPKKNFNLKKFLDCAIFEYSYAALYRQNIQVDSARAAYVPSGTDKRVWPRSWISEDAHIQLCVRSADCILGSWLAKPL